MFIKIHAFFCIILLFDIGSHAQNPWIQKAPFGGGPRYASVGFSIGHYGFIGCGTTLPNWNYSGAKNDFWRWDEYTNTWAQIANYPGTNYELSTGFTIEGKGYVCFGWNGSNGANDLWEYDTITNVWTQKATFPGLARYDVSGFVIGHKAYIIAGSSGGPPYYSDVWVYNAHADSWKQLNNFPESNVESVIAFSIGNHGYAGNGYVNPGCDNIMYQYDTTSDTWTLIAAIPSTYSIIANGGTCVIGSKGFVFNGDDCTSPGVQTGYVYDTLTKSWCAFTSMGASKMKRTFTVAFVINNHIYMGTGTDTNFNNLGDFAEYAPSVKYNALDTILCFGDSVHFNDISTYFVSNWKWSFSGGNPASSNLQNPSVVYTHSGLYNVKLVIHGCDFIDSITKQTNVILIPNISIIGNDTVCRGDGTTIYASGGTSYLWNTGATTSSITVNPSSTTNLCVAVSNAGCAADSCFKVIVIPDPSVSLNITLSEESGNTVCQSFQLYTLDGGSPSGGTYSGSQVLGGRQFLPDSAGKNVVTYSYTDKYGCIGYATDTIYVNVCTGIQNIMNGIRMNIYPNPTSGLIHIKYNVLNGQQTEFKIMDIYGRYLNSYKIDGQENEMTLNETSLNDGMYFYQVIEGGKLISSGKFIIAK